MRAWDFEGGFTTQPAASAVCGRVKDNVCDHYTYIWLYEPPRRGMEQIRWHNACRGGCGDWHCGHGNLPKPSELRKWFLQPLLSAPIIPWHVWHWSGCSKWVLQWQNHRRPTLFPGSHPNGWKCIRPGPQFGLGWGGTWHVSDTFFLSFMSFPSRRICSFLPFIALGTNIHEVGLYSLAPMCVKTEGLDLP